MIQLPITIEVKQEHIDRGVRHDCRYCVIALAIRDMVNDPNAFVKALFNIAEIYYENPYRFYSLELPRQVTQFIDAFDRGCKVIPFTFTIEKVY